MTEQTKKKPGRPQTKHKVNAFVEDITINKPTKDQVDEAIFASLSKMQEPKKVDAVAPKNTKPIDKTKSLKDIIGYDCEEAFDGSDGDFLERWGIEKTKDIYAQKDYLASELQKLFDNKKPVLAYIMTMGNNDPLRQIFTRMLLQREELHLNPKWQFILHPDAELSPIDPQGLKITDGALVCVVGNLEQADGVWRNDLAQGGLLGLDYNAKDKTPSYNSGQSRNDRLRRRMPIYKTVSIYKDKVTTVTLREALIIMREWGYRVAFRSSNSMKGVTQNPWKILQVMV